MSRKRFDTSTSPRMAYFSNLEHVCVLDFNDFAILDGVLVEAEGGMRSIDKTSSP